MLQEILQDKLRVFGSTNEQFGQQSLLSEESTTREKIENYLKQFVGLATFYGRSITLTNYPSITWVIAISHRAKNIRKN